MSPGIRHDAQVAVTNSGMGTVDESLFSPLFFYCINRGQCGTYSLIKTSPAAGSGKSFSTTLTEILPGSSYTAAEYF